MPSTIAPTCIETSKSSIINCKENKCSISFINRHRKKVKKIVVDDCAIRDGIRCDYLILSDTRIEHFVELKGTDINHAFKQLKRSIELLSADAKNSPKHSYVISIRVPLTTTSIQFQKAVFKKAYNSSLVIRNKHLDVLL